jgi:hypothetical protein
MTMGDLYEVSLRASGKRKITLNTVSMSSIYNGPPAICPHNIMWKFLQSGGAIAYDLHQPGGVTFLCSGMYLEQEMHGGHLHLHTSMLGGGLILQELEPQKKETPEKKLSMEKAPPMEVAPVESLE